MQHFNGDFCAKRWLGPSGQRQSRDGGTHSQDRSFGSAEVEGVDPLGGKDAPALYFGSTKINNSSDVVDAVAKEHDGVATVFVKSGDDFIRVTTNVKKDDGSRAVGTVLDPKGPVIGVIRRGEAYYGDANILGKPYVTGYEPIRDAQNKVIGIYFVGYAK